MGIIRGADAGGIKAASFGASAGRQSEAHAVVFEQVDRRGTRVVPAEAPAPPQPAAPPPPPVFDVPGEVLQSFYDQAIAQGLEDGKAQVFAELSVLQARYAAGLEQLGALSRELAAHNQRQILLVACKLAERIVRHTIQANPAVLYKMLDEELHKLEGVDEATVVCSGPDFDFIAESAPKLAEGVGGVFKLRVAPDPELEYGDFRIETRIGSVDGVVPSRIAELEASLGADDV